MEDPAGEWKGMPEFTSEANRPFRSLRVYFADAKAVRRFADRLGQAVPVKAPSMWFPEKKKAKPLSQVYVNRP